MQGEALPAPFEWLGNDLVELNSGRPRLSDAATGEWVFRRGERLQETMRFRARAGLLRELRYEVATYRRMFGRYVLVHRAAAVPMGDFPARDEPYEFVCPLQTIPNGPKALLCGINRTVIQFSSANHGPLFERVVVAELQ